MSIFFILLFDKFEKFLCIKCGNTCPVSLDFLFNNDFQYIEEITDYINTLLDAQTKGELPYDLLFLWDSVGSVPCKMTFDGKGGKMHNAATLADKIGMGLNQRIGKSRRQDSKYINTLVVVNQPWVELPDNPFGQPKIKAKGGESLWLNSTLVFRFGNQKNGGTTNITAVKEKRKVKLLLDHIGSEITHDWNDVENCDYHLLNELTTDGYEVFVFKDPQTDVILCENVYYYNHNLGEQVVETLMCGNTVIYIDESEYDDLYIEDRLVEEFTELVDEIIWEANLTNNEIKELKDEYGIEEEIPETT